MLVNNTEERNRMDMDSAGLQRVYPDALRVRYVVEGRHDQARRPAFEPARNARRGPRQAFGPRPLNIIKDLLSRLHYADKDERLILPDPQIVFAYDAAYLEGDQLAK